MFHICGLRCCFWVQIYVKVWNIASRKSEADASLAVEDMPWLCLGYALVMLRICLGYA